MSVTPAETRASIWCTIMGLFANSTSGFGSVRVYSCARAVSLELPTLCNRALLSQVQCARRPRTKGRRRVPKPPTRMSPASQTLASRCCGMVAALMQPCNHARHTFHDCGIVGALIWFFDLELGGGPVRGHKKGGSRRSRCGAKSSKVRKP
jgi:hypothetical protein